MTTKKTTAKKSGPYEVTLGSIRFVLHGRIAEFHDATDGDSSFMRLDVIERVRLHTHQSRVQITIESVGSTISQRFGRSVEVADVRAKLVEPLLEAMGGRA